MGKLFSKLQQTNAYTILVGKPRGRSTDSIKIGCYDHNQLPYFSIVSLSVSHLGKNRCQNSQFYTLSNEKFVLVSLIKTLQHSTYI
jgi:hypothetical protein